MWETEEDGVKRMQVLQELYYLLLGNRMHLNTIPINVFSGAHTDYWDVSV
jgi:hypothetical protein